MYGEARQVRVEMRVLGAQKHDAFGNRRESTLQRSRCTAAIVSDRPVPARQDLSGYFVLR